MIAAILLSMRPLQWTKNTLIFAALFFSGNLRSGSMLLTVTMAFILFSLISGSVYIINDIHDIDEDREHPEKRQRPVASGRLPQPFAVAVASCIVPACLIAAFALEKSFGIIALVYFALMIAYTFLLRSVAIIDLLTVAAGFVLRAVAGVCLIGVDLSPWLIVCTTFLALLILLGKRYHEAALVRDCAVCGRTVLSSYSPMLLNQLISISASAVILAYTLYTLSGDTVSKYGTRNLVYTTPFVLFGVFRYLYLVYIKKDGGRPERLMFRDLQLLGAIGGWIAALYFFVYHS